ncbi:hypothetical protein JMUB5056_1804 [Leptotrichia hongkongensis]|uniref:Uncharacterized protein n=1 Tax=Leptotrichia hongkongensis TaxID=554406 RepID=A0A510L859_9FUSO|nr:hypothetical protein JMUB5056_1804 [Leptotrichia hongkongensis]
MKNLYHIFECTQEAVQLFKINENLGNNETDKIKIVYFTPDKISNYEKKKQEKNYYVWWRKIFRIFRNF